MSRRCIVDAWLDSIHPHSPPPCTDMLASRPASSCASSSAMSCTPRSTRPVQGIASLAFENGFRYVLLDDVDDETLDADTSVLRDRLLEVEQGTGVVPDAVRPFVEALPHAQRARFRYHNYASLWEERRPHFELQHEFRDVQDIARRSARYDGSAQYSEAAWNDAVHSNVLQTALRPQPHVFWENVTHARIYPRDLVPRIAASSPPVEAKMVDYAILIHPPDEMQSSLLSALRREAELQPPGPAAPLLSLNHTDYAPIRTSPIAVSIATTATDGNESQAKAQLAVWGASHLARLDRLRRASAASASPQDGATAEESDGGECSNGRGRLAQRLEPLPVLPLVFVAGVHWDLYFLAMRDDRSVTMVGSLRLGDTTSTLDIYKLLCGLRVLAEWAERLGAWWRRAVLSWVMNPILLDYSL
ncbi:hypothetical protein GTA08_BOTSDO12605 [Neofusicoccum parvum]|nr:hypothetical protein GTA08_BOTSDO12605 [Neofusicoccum parvum]